MKLQELANTKTVFTAQKERNCFVVLEQDNKCMLTIPQSPPQNCLCIHSYPVIEAVQAIQLYGVWASKGPLVHYDYVLVCLFSKEFTVLLKTEPLYAAPNTTTVQRYVKVNPSSLSLFPCRLSCQGVASNNCGIRVCTQMAVSVNLVNCLHIHMQEE